MPGGRMAEPGLIFAGSPPMLYVAEPVWNATWARWFGWHSPTIAGSVILATLLAAVWWMRRVIKRPRQAGRMYCRVCNQQLAKPQLMLNEEKRAVWADAEAKCPECGVRHKRGPVRGRLQFARMMPVLLVAPVVLFVCGLVMLATLRFQQPSVWTGGTWPVSGMEKLLGAWSLGRRGITTNMQSTRLWRVDPRTGAKEQMGRFDSWNLAYMEFVSPDGKYAVAPVENGRRMMVIDLTSKARAVYAAGTDFLSNLSMRRFSLDGTRVFIDKATYRNSGTLHELVTFEPATGKFETIASVALPTGNPKAGTYSTQSYQFRETPERVAWVEKSDVRSATGRGESSVLRWEADGKKMERSDGSAAGSLQIELSDDGNACIVSDVMARTTKAFDLKTGDDLVTMPRVGDSQERDRAGPRIPGYSATGFVTIMSAKGVPREVGQLSVSAQGWSAMGSADGRFAAAQKERDVVTRIGAMLGAPPTVAWNVQVWDFEKLLDRQTDEPLGKAATKSAAP